MARDGQQAFRPLRHVPYAVNPLAWTWPDVEQGIPRRDHAVDQAGDNGPPGTAALDSRQLSLCLAQGREQLGLLCLGLPDLPILGQDQRLGLAELFVLALDQPVLAGDQVGIEALRNAGGKPAVQP